jgi:type IV pilus assembly protein PilE
MIFFLSQKGFHLIEVLMTLTIIGMLITISIPTYIHYLAYAHRLEAIYNLGRCALNLEHHYIATHTYRDANLDIESITTHNIKSHYRFFIKNATNHSYALVAQPIGQQALNDTMCGTLFLNSLGEKSISGTRSLDECWN